MVLEIKKFEVTKIQLHFKSRTMSKVKPLSFEGETIYVGLDAHKTNWKIHSRMRNIDLAAFSQDPNPEVLSNHFKRNYPGAKVKVVYEAGFCGFGIQRSLTQLGIECIVVNAADVPASDKERKRKDDQRDAYKLSRELADGSLNAIYVPSVEMEQARSLVRQRYRLVQDQTRCKNRIKHMLMFSGIRLNIDSERWSKRYVKALQEAQCDPALRKTLDLAIEQYEQMRTIIKQAERDIANMATESPFGQLQPYIQSIGGIGLINGMVIQTEIQDMHRFKTLSQLCDYAGFVPDISSSDQKMVVKGITYRYNEFLRKAIIESSWMLIRHDPAMLMKYTEYRRRMSKNKAIIRIAKHLLARIRYVWNNQKKYENGIVA
jgi:transposase